MVVEQQDIPKTNWVVCVLYTLASGACALPITLISPEHSETKKGYESFSFITEHPELAQPFWLSCIAITLLTMPFLIKFAWNRSLAPLLNANNMEYGQAYILFMLWTVLLELVW